MIIKTKICGISTTDDYIACRDAGASFVGMVHYPGSPRHLDLKALAKLAACSATCSSNAPYRVLLSVDVPSDNLLPLIEAGHPDLLQLHGNETPELVAAIKTRFGLPIIKSIAIETHDDLNQCAIWDGVADWLLFDAKVKAGEQPGGTGHSFDWTILKNYKGRYQALCLLLRRHRWPHQYHQGTGKKAQSHLNHRQYRLQAHLEGGLQPQGSARAPRCR